MASFEIYITDITGRVVNNVQIIAQRQQNGSYITQGSTRTNIGGYAYLGALTAGEYKIILAKPTYITGNVMKSLYAGAHITLNEMVYPISWLDEPPIDPGQPIECPLGTHWDPVQMTCVLDPGTPPPTPQCPSGYYWDTTLKVCMPQGGGPIPPTPQECPPGTHWDPVQMTCVLDTPIIPMPCPSGQHWDVYQNKCVPDTPVIPTCPEGTHWDPVYQTCVLDPPTPPPTPPPGGCGEGRYWDAQYGACLLIPQQCQTGYKWSKVYQQCIEEYPDGNGEDPQQPPGKINLLKTGAIILAVAGSLKKKKKGK